MSAARHLQQGQLSMFLPAGHIVDPEKTVLGDQEPWQSHDDIKQEKLTQARRGGGTDFHGEMTAHFEADHRQPRFYDHIAEHGVQEPVIMSHHAEDPSVHWLIDGHHRAFSANEINPKMEVPVTWE